MKQHVSWIKEIGVEYTKDRKKVNIFEFQCTHEDHILDEWAKHFRQQYCSDSELDEESKANGLSKKDYLLNIKFPTEKGAPGPSIRAGDFAEILVSDYIEFVLNYYVPRTRYDSKIVKNESTKGCDIIAFKVGKKFSTNDEMFVMEVKAQFSGNKPENRLQDAINDSAKDITRLAESLNAIKQRLKFRGEQNNVATVQRFQNITDSHYKRKMGAAAVQSDNYYDKALINNASIEEHPEDDLVLIHIKGSDFMILVHDLYRRASVC